MLKSFSLYWLRKKDATNKIKHKSSLLESKKNCRFNCTPWVLLNQCTLNAQRKKDNHKHCSQLGRGQWGGREVLAILVDSARKASSKDTGSTEWGCRRKDRKGEDTEKPIKVLPLIFFQCSNQGRKDRGDRKAAELNYLAGKATEESEPCSISSLSPYLFPGARPAATVLHTPQLPHTPSPSVSDHAPWGMQVSWRI